MFFLGATPNDIVKHVILMKWLAAIMSFAMDCSLVLMVAKWSSATDQLFGCEAQHRNRSYGDFSITTVAASQVVLVVKIIIATVAAITTGQLFVHWLSWIYLKGRKYSDHLEIGIVGDKYTTITPITQPHSSLSPHKPNPQKLPWTQQKTASILWENSAARNIERILMGLCWMIFFRLMP